MMRRYSVFGETLETSYRFRTPIADADPGAPVDVQFTCLIGDPVRPEGQCVYASAEKAQNGVSVVRIFRDHQLHRVSFSGIAEFAVVPSNTDSPAQITCSIPAPEHEYMVEVCLFGHVFAYYLESIGVPALHAGAVEIDGSAVLFVADRTGGKSTVVASCTAAGFPLIADDIAAVAVTPREVGVPVCRRAYPQLKMTPEHVQRFLGRSEQFERVHPSFEKLGVPVSEIGSFARGARPIARVYLLERTSAADNTPRILDVPPGETTVLLVRHSFLAGIVDQTEFRVHRFARLGAIARGVRAARLVYPSGFDRIPELIDAILSDVRTLA